MSPPKKKLEIVDVEPYDLCNFSTSASRKFPDVDSDQEMKEAMKSEEEQPKASD